MCGIVGYIGNKEKKEFLLDGLRELEYRGYDSSGMAIITEDEKSFCFKATGKIDNLAQKMQKFSSDGMGVGIAHTRWATHGKPTEANAHPHLGNYSFTAHNGIIENYKELKESLLVKGVTFESKTDSEVIVHLFESINNEIKDPFVAFTKTIAQLKGSFAILLITKAAKDTIFFAKQSTPLIVGKNKDGEVVFASCDAPLIKDISKAIYLEDGEYGFAKFGDISLFKNGKKIEPLYKELPKNRESAQKNGYRFFMEKEIYEQSDIANNCLLERVKDDDILFDEIDENIFKGIDEIIFGACGTSYHAALTASYLFERIAKIRVKVDIASEFRYKKPLIKPNSLFIAISQSGETADTLGALDVAKKAGIKTLAICNVDNSSMVRTADYSILTRAGVEKGVASTKAFSMQVLVLWMLVLLAAKVNKRIEKSELKSEIKAILSASKALKVDKQLQAQISKISKNYLKGHGFFYIGRDIFYPLALEGALKLKEISYLHAEGYPSGEMKHGPIALVDDGLYTIALMPELLLYEKTKSNVEELISRNSKVLAISPLPFELANDLIMIQRESHPMLEYFSILKVLQLFALEICVSLGNNVDMPRNLAKSVTVE